MKNKSAILCGVSTLALVACLSTSMAFAENNAPDGAQVPSSQNLHKKKKTKKKKHSKKHASNRAARPATSAHNASAEKVSLDTPADSITTSSASANVVASDNISQMSANDQGTYAWLKKHVEASYFGVYRGAALGNLGDTYQPDQFGNPGPGGAADGAGAQGLESYVTTGYKFGQNSEWMAGLNTHFFDNAAPQAAAGGHMTTSNFEMLNPSLEVTKTNLINYNHWKLKGYLFVQLPMSSYDTVSAPGNNGLTAVQFAGNLTYDIPGTRWTLGYYTYLMGYFYGPDGNPGTRTVKYYGAPNVSYQALPTVAATVWVDAIQLSRNQGTGFISGMDNYTMDIEPGFAWDIIPGNLTINPVINFYPGYPTLAATSVQAVIIGKAW